MHMKKRRKTSENIKRQNVKNEVKIIKNDQNNDRQNTDEEETERH